MTFTTFNRAICLLTILCLVSTECDSLNKIHAQFDKFLRLIGAVVEWDKSLVVELLGQGANPNIHIQYVAELIMPPMAEEKQRIHPFHLMGIAVTFSTEDVLRRLLAAGGDANAVIDAAGHRPIHAAIDRGHLGMIKALARRGADVNMTLDGEGLLHHAISAHEVQVVELLLKLGADPKAKDQHGRDSLEASRHAWCRGCEMVLLNKKRPWPYDSN